MATANRRDRGKKTTIIRRQIKKSHAGHHGGAWKVAFADFTLAMMALFMTLWIVNSVSQSDREEIVAALHAAARQCRRCPARCCPWTGAVRQYRRSLAPGRHSSRQSFAAC